nr:MAG TPA: hypothetical protein [Caudoviricetes sp.]
MIIPRTLICHMGYRNYTTLFRRSQRKTTKNGGFPRKFMEV